MATARQPLRRHVGQQVEEHRTVGRGQRRRARVRGRRRTDGAEQPAAARAASPSSARSRNAVVVLPLVPVTPAAHEPVVRAAVQPRASSAGSRARVGRATIAAGRPAAARAPRPGRRVRVDHHRGAAAGHGVGHEGVAVAAGAAHGHEQRAGSGPARVDRHAPTIAVRASPASCSPGQAAHRRASVSAIASPSRPSRRALRRAARRRPAPGPPRSRRRRTTTGRPSRAARRADLAVRQPAEVGADLTPARRPRRAPRRHGHPDRVPGRAAGAAVGHLLDDQPAALVAAEHEAGAAQLLRGGRRERYSTSGTLAVGGGSGASVSAGSGPSTPVSQSVDRRISSTTPREQRRRALRRVVVRVIGLVQHGQHDQARRLDRARCRRSSPCTCRAGSRGPARPSGRCRSCRRSSSTARRPPCRYRLPRPAAIASRTSRACSGVRTRRTTTGSPRSMDRVVVVAHLAHEAGREQAAAVGDGGPGHRQLQRRDRHLLADGDRRQAARRPLRRPAQAFRRGSDW